MTAQRRILHRSLRGYPTCHGMRRMETVIHYMELWTHGGDTVVWEFEDTTENVCSVRWQVVCLICDFQNVSRTRCAYRSATLFQVEGHA